jgi:hypothetical protein
VTVKLESLRAVPSGLVTESGPLVAPVGTMARNKVSLSTVKLAPESWKATAVTVAKPLPLTVTSVPIGLLVGLKAVSVGGEGGGGGGGGTVTVKLESLRAVPSGLVTESGPLVAPVGTMARNKVSLSTVKLALESWKATAVTVAKPLPFTVTSVPTGPPVGLKLPTVGGTGSAVETVVCIPASNRPRRTVPGRPTANPRVRQSMVSTSKWCGVPSADLGEKTGRSSTQIRASFGWSDLIGCEFLPWPRCIKRRDFSARKRKPAQ